MQKTFAIILASGAMAVLWLAASPPSAFASHYRHIAYNADVCDPGESSGQYCDGRYTWAMKTWVDNASTTKYCNGMGDTVHNQAILDAVANWEMQFNFPFPEFTPTCGAGQNMDIVDDRWGQAPCLEPYVGCMSVASWHFDSVRNGYYMNYVRIWVHYPFYAFDYWGMRATVAHEIGHIYGLDDK